MTANFESLAPASWQARVPFRFVVGEPLDISVLIDLTPGWYFIAVDFILNRCPKWQNTPADITGCFNYDTEGSHWQEETTQPRNFSDFRPMGSAADDQFYEINDVPWPWGHHLDCFYTTMGGPASYAFAIDGNKGGGTPGEVVEGWVRLLLEKRA